jgi:arylsulfatase A-like enzyme
MWRRYHNVHGAVNLPSSTLQAPLETVKLYNRTQLDTYKVAGAMITKLDDGVGAVQAALEARAAPYILAFCADNGGPLDHATNAPLKGGKHTLWGKFRRHCHSRRLLGCTTVSIRSC